MCVYVCMCACVFAIAMYLRNLNLFNELLLSWSYKPGIVTPATQVKVLVEKKKKISEHTVELQSHTQIGKVDSCGTIC